MRLKSVTCCWWSSRFKCVSVTACKWPLVRAHVLIWVPNWLFWLWVQTVDVPSSLHRLSCHCPWLELWEKLPSRDFLLSPDVSHVARLHWLSHAGATVLDPSLQCSVVVSGTHFEVSSTSIWVLALTLPSSMSILCLFCPRKWTSYCLFHKVYEVLRAVPGIC